MESADDIGGHEAFVPPPPDPEQSEWPPATRAIAMRWAREARLREPRGIAAP
jgi:hypothetical protein